MTKPLAIASVALIAFAGPVAAQNTRIELTLVDHITAGMIEQDVYVTASDGEGVVRVTPENAERYRNAPVFGTAEVVHHAPMNPLAIGPYPRGRALGPTLGEWLSARGEVTYTCSGGQGTVDASFRGLVPGGLYTMWYAFLPTPPTRPFATLDLPLGARDGSQSVFTADEHGGAQFTRTFAPCLQLTGARRTAMLAVAWHSDDRTWGSYPGPFGQGTHIQVFAPLPSAAEVGTLR